jgi:hypothetical protein
VLGALAKRVHHDRLDRLRHVAAHGRRGRLEVAHPAMVISSESIDGIIGSDIDVVEDLGIEKAWFTQLKVVLRPARKHKFRFEYTPIKYDAETVLRRDIIFNGIEFPIAIPIESELIWRAYRFSYEYDFIYRDRGFLGLVLEAKYTDVEARLTNAVDLEFIHARAPIPAVGLIGRGYVAPNIAITGEFTFVTRKNLVIFLLIKNFLSSIRKVQRCWNLMVKSCG